MKIADTLRQECMPEMVYSVCKLSKNSYTRAEIQKMITLAADDKESQSQFSNVFNFARDCNFISEKDGEVMCLLEPEKLDSFKQFRMQVNKGIFQNRSTKFYKASEWFLSQEDTDIFSLETAEKLSTSFTNALDFNPDKSFALGFRFWIVALGFAAFQGYRKSAIGFACHDIIGQWVYDCSLKQGVQIPARAFFEALCNDIGIFETMMSNNKLNLALSSALRTLRDAGVIKLIYTKDSSDVWHLYESKLDAGNSDRFTEILIEELY